MNIPLCPHCKKGTRRTEVMSMTTCMGYSRTYDEMGRDITNNPNTINTTYRCEKCGKNYSVLTKNGKILRVD